MAKWTKKDKTGVWVTIALGDKNVGLLWRSLIKMLVYYGLRWVKRVAISLGDKEENEEDCSA